MTTLHATLSKTEMILRRLRSGNAEATNIDAKEMLHLKQNGDCASFIRHIAALANTGRKAYLVIGVEDKTWVVKGLPADSPLQNVDATQQQMNQLLAQRLDPSVAVGYCTHHVDGKLVGVVGVEGEKSPYVVSITDPRFGGTKTDGGESYIYKGVIYMRRGTDSIPACRQSEILEIVNGRRDYWEVAITLVFIGVVVAIGVGVGISLVRFSNWYSAAILGLLWGIIAGWFLNKRLADAFGKIPIGTFGRIMRLSGGPIWGGIVGAFLSCVVEEKVVTGQIKPLDPITMVLLLVILAVPGILVALAYLYMAQDIIGKLRR